MHKILFIFIVNIFMFIQFISLYKENILSKFILSKKIE